MKLQSVELRVADLAGTAEFFERIWGLQRVGGGGAMRMRATGAMPYVIALEAGEPGIRSITFCGSPQEIASFGGERSIQGPEGQVYRLVVAQPVAPLPADRDRPIELSHVVLNSTDVEAAERFAHDVLGFKVSDRTRHMTFVRCDRTHHCVAYARSPISSLNHIAFKMQDLDAVMRGIGRLRDAGYACVWGPGRHGPGNNVFAYFIGPHGGNIEYTAEVEEVSEDYKVGSPQDWKWPPGRIDHWGVSSKDTAKTEAAERVFVWNPQ